MKNKEKYEENLMDLAINGLAVTKENEVAECYYLECFKCIFSDEEGNCVKDARRWLDEEYKEPPILNESEKHYLEAVLSPFKNRVIHIRKLQESYRGVELHYIRVNMEAVIDDEPDYITFPYFAENTMYKGMKLSKDYTLKDLALFKKEKKC